METKPSRAWPDWPVKGGSGRLFPALSKERSQAAGCCPPHSFVSEFPYAPGTSWMAAVWGTSRENTVLGGTAPGRHVRS